MRIIRLPEVIRRTGWSKTTIRRKELEGKFPRRRQYSENCVGWVEQEVDEHLRQLIAEADAQPAAPARDTKGKYRAGRSIRAGAAA